MDKKFATLTGFPGIWVRIARSHLEPWPPLPSARQGQGFCSLQVIGV